MESCINRNASKRQEEIHVVAIAYPAHGHITPMLQLCSFLDARGFTVTFVYTQSFSGLHRSLPSNNISFVCIPDSLPACNSSSQASTLARVLASELLVHAFSGLIQSLLPNVSCIISDALLSWAQDVALQFDIAGAVLWTTTASCCAAYSHIPLLVSHGYLPMKDAHEDSITGIAVLPPLFRVTDLPSFFHVQSLPDDVLDFIVRQTNLMRKATWILSNSVSLEIERDVEEELQKEMPIMSVGPLLVLTPHSAADLGVSLWHDDETCLDWLKGRPPASVLYIAFGSLVVFSSQQIQEIAMGLEASQQPFLWALRPESVVGEEWTILQDEFQSRTADRGRVVSWAPQRQVLEQEAVGGFLTHCGWNSVMESICRGKPMLGCPRFAEQRMNCRLLEEWKVGRRLREGPNGLLERSEVEEQIRAFMGSQEAPKIRSRCVELKAEVLRSVLNEDGSSSRNLNNFVNALLDMKISRPSWELMKAS